MLRSTCATTWTFCESAPDGVSATTNRALGAHVKIAKRGLLRERHGCRVQKCGRATCFVQSRVLHKRDNRLLDRAILFKKDSNSLAKPGCKSDVDSMLYGDVLGHECACASIAVRPLRGLVTLPTRRARAHLRTAGHRFVEQLELQLPLTQRCDEHHRAPQRAATHTECCEATSGGMSPGNTGGALVATQPACLTFFCD